jgi:hypothetical protein
MKRVIMSAGLVRELGIGFEPDQEMALSLEDFAEIAVRRADI